MRVSALWVGRGWQGALAERLECAVAERLEGVAAERLARRYFTGAADWSFCTSSLASSLSVLGTRIFTTA